MKADDGRRLRGGVLAAVLAGLILPVTAGLGETLSAAFGYFPAIGARHLSFEPWRVLLATPGLMTSLRLTLTTGIGATLLSLILAFALAAWLDQRRPLARLLAPLLAAPHAAMAIGLAFVIAPSGWIGRIASQLVTGATAPADLAIVHDTHGLALILGLAVKEMPFLALVILIALGQIGAARQMAAAQALGYRRAKVWLVILGPQVYRLIRLPCYVVLAFSLSVVDMAVILGPSTPPSLAQATVRWLQSPDLRQILPGAASALSLLALTAAAVLAWRLAEALLSRAIYHLARQGGRGNHLAPVLSALGAAALLLAALGGLSLAVLLVWSVSWRWPFPAVWPESLYLALWFDVSAPWHGPLGATFLIGLSSAALSVLLAILWLEGEDRAHLPRARWAEAMIYLPLLVPQVAFLFGLQVAFLRVGIAQGMMAVVWAHAVFVFPYVMLTLSDPWRALDPRLERAAASLGAGPWRRLVRVKLPCMLAPVLTAAAVGFSVSVVQYLPTLFMGGGRIVTLTTEAVTLSSGGDRRIVGAYGFLQSILPLASYAVALIFPAAARRRLHVGA